MPLKPYRKSFSARKRGRENYRAKYPEKRKADWTVDNAIRRGLLKKGPCEYCGSLKVHAHHEDYANPLDVKWLCPKHHLLRHKTEKHLLDLPGPLAAIMASSSIRIIPRGNNYKALHLDSGRYLRFHNISTVSLTAERQSTSFSTTDQAAAVVKRFVARFTGGAPINIVRCGV